MKRVVAWATLLVALLAGANWLDPVRAGLNGAYYTNANWADAPALSTIDAVPSDQRLLDAFHGGPPAQFSVTWAGSLLAMNDGPYTLATISDDGSAVYVDGQIVVDNSGSRDGARGASGLVNLTRGVHALYVRYAQEGGAFHIELLWARAGQPLTPLPAWALTPRRVSFAGFAASAAVKRALAAAEWIWVGALVLWALAVAWSWILRARAWLEREGVWAAFKWILAGSLILNATGLWWGLPGGSWVPDELTPTLVLGAAAQWFAHGWFDRYPPFHFYVLTAAFSPLILLEWMGRLELHSTAPYTFMAVVGRLISLAAAAGTLVSIYAAGALSFGKRAGFFAAAMFALVTPFVYYAKTANLDAPYLFWFALSLVFYLRALERRSLRDFVLFAAFGALAICTKDQAYGLYLLMPFALVERLWRDNRDRGQQQPLFHALVDRRMMLSAVVALVLFVCIHNLLFNLGGFLDHVRLITGPASETYRDFPSTLQGRAALLRLTLDILQMAWGWPMLLICGAGLAIALPQQTSRQAAIWLALPIVSYYAGFIDVVLYNYDRFMLPVCLVLSLFGGLALDRWLPQRLRKWSGRTAAGCVAFAYSLLCAATVDVAMLGDSRYTVEQWLSGRVTAADVVGYVFPQQYYPRFDRFNSAEITSVNALRQAQPSYYVLNADYARAEPRDTEIGRLIAALEDETVGYTLVLRCRNPIPWWWLPGAPRDLVGDRHERPIVSVLRHINPVYEVFRRESRQTPKGPQSSSR
jgi:hypothetical protein